MFLSQHASHLTRFHLSIGFLVLKERNTVTNVSNLFPACIMPRHTFVFARQIPRWINLNSHVFETRVDPPNTVIFNRLFSNVLDRIQTHFVFNDIASISRRIKLRFSSRSKNGVLGLVTRSRWIDFRGSFFFAISIRITAFRPCECQWQWTTWWKRFLTTFSLFRVLTLISKFSWWFRKRSSLIEGKIRKAKKSWWNL